MSNTIYTSHAVVLEQDYSSVLLEKNERFGGKLTLFGGKFEDGEDNLECIKREIYEEIGLVLFTPEIHLLKKDDELILGNTTFIGYIYYILLHKKQINKALLHSNRNVQIETTPESLGEVDFAFDKVKSQINDCLNILKY